MNPRLKNSVKVFLMSISIILLCFLILGIYPFGDKSIVIIDSNTQYVAFLSYFRTILLGLNDFKYTMSSTLGQNFVPLLGYYLMSIFNLFTIFFKPENMKIFLTILMIVKIGLCSVSMEYYLSKKYKKNTVLFSICYGLMAYNIVFMYHVMWFDSIIIFPFVILGIDKIFEDKNPLLYIISLGLSIIFNYYIGFIICLASVLYFIYKFIFEYKKIDIFKVIVNYGVSSLLAGALSAFILLPSLMGLMNGKVGNDLVWGFNLSYLNVIAKAFTCSVGLGETWNGGPMIACSMFVFILVLLYFFNKNISRKEKIINGLSIVFLMTTFVFKPLNLVFHGFNDPNAFNYRHAFILVFFIVSLAIRSYNKLSLRKKDVKCVRYIFVSICLLVLLGGYKFNVSTFNISIFISLLLGLLILRFIDKKRIVVYLVFIDLFINVFSCILMLRLSDVQSMSYYKNYVSSVNEAVESIKDNGLYRVEKSFDREFNKSMLAINDSMIFNYAGISHFDSTNSINTDILFERFGLRRLLTRTYYNKNSTHFIDSLFGLKYIISNEKYKDYDLINEFNGIYVYENPYNLSIGYAIKDDNVIFENNPFINQNNILKSFSGIEKDVYIESSYNLSTENILIDGNKYVSLYDGYINMNVDIEYNDNLFLYVPLNDHYPNGKVYINDVYYSDYLTKYEWNTLDLGSFNIGDNVNIKIVFDNYLAFDDIYLYYENMDNFEEHYNVLKVKQVNFDMVSSSYYKGDINLDEPSKVIFTIPYDEGWNISVNGEEIDFYKSLDDLLMVSLDSGASVIELSYSPKGLKGGIYISFIGTILTLIYVIFKDKIWCLYDKFKEIFNYLIVGALTTVVSLCSYYIFSRVLNIENTIYFLIANTLSWILSVAFAYITNKLFVFNSKECGRGAIKEMFRFVSSRLLTYFIDLIMMIVMVKLIHFNNDLAKLLVQVVVLILNYILSKLLVFKKN